MSVLSLAPGRPKTKRRKVKSLYPDAGNSNAIINREELTETISIVLKNTQDIRLTLLFLRGGTSKAPSSVTGGKYQRDPEKCWDMLDFLSEEINVEMGKLLRAMATKKKMSNP